MSDMAPEPGGGGTPGTGKIMGLPIWAWVGIAAIGAYFLFFRNPSSSSGSGTSGTSGTSTTGGTTINPGTTTINVNASPTANPQPKVTAAHPKTKKTSTTKLLYTVKAGDTLQSIAKKYGVSIAALAHSNVYVAGEVPGNKKVGQRLGTGAGLKVGQKLKIP